MKSNLLLGAAAVLALTSLGVAYAKPSPAVIAAVADKARPEADTALDAERKPAEMLDFAGVAPGQTVVDLIPGGGYFTRVFSKAVGPKGTVYAVGGPPRPPADPAKPSPPPAQDVIAADANYANVKSIHAPLAGGLAIPTQADVIWTSQNYHDVKNVPNIDMLAFDKAIYNALKPGGVFVVLDHVAKADTVNPTSTVHRIDPAVVKKEVEAAGFKFEGESTVLRNPGDDYAKNVFDPAVRHKTDQFIYKFRKPK
ncbi:methyltransferase [Phenylobacterium sp.]|uniref:class I SAM-dependent methyltransferase n=1 Tax=Phenylobacterium sp. TaxID=1871053 RepID=UPI0025F034F3|nr:methyltransferase [Phenylobacterium sp.]